jgi:hypothetical protein
MSVLGLATAGTDVRSTKQCHSVHCTDEMQRADLSRRLGMGLAELRTAAVMFACHSR